MSSRQSFCQRVQFRSFIDNESDEAKKSSNINKAARDEYVRQRLKKKKDARELAREEERNYVEFRKMEVLYHFRPKSAAASRKQDDSFPRRKRGVSMGFGERKAYFLSIRPNPKFATWFGKKQESKSTSSPILLPFKPMPEKSVRPQFDDDDDLDDTKRSSSEKKGKNAANPFIRGCPFWTVSTGEEEELGEEDYPVDVDAIEKVVNGAELKQPPYMKKTFDVYAEIECFKKDDVLFSNAKASQHSTTSMFVHSKMPCAFQRTGIRMHSNIVGSESGEALASHDAQGLVLVRPQTDQAIYHSTIKYLLPDVFGFKLLASLFCKSW
ncbi:hypothetical protein KIN20_003160 [Parelaphostrongylus tenuis]|uniref:Uncharacterized protein n=1 Tax=Parelaphostrongylus tenuis TaxID=148309 RepID=A0AAD5QH85_PARTN|nr:hypothetical protein KIN20_003160 [Parelaphostrongylus tenuis]